MAACAAHKESNKRILIFADSAYNKIGTGRASKVRKTIGQEIPKKIYENEAEAERIRKIAKEVTKSYSGNEQHLLNLEFPEYLR